MSHQPSQSIVWSIPTAQGVPGPPSHLFATYFNGYGPPNPHVRYYHPHSSSSSRSHVYPAHIPPNQLPPRKRRASTGEGPRVSPHIIDPPPSHHPRSRPVSHSPSHHSHVQPPASYPAHSSSHPRQATKSILKNGSRGTPPPPQTPYVRPPRESLAVYLPTSHPKSILMSPLSTRSSRVLPVARVVSPFLT